MSEISLQSYSFILPFISLVFSFVGVVIGLICIWRAEKRLKIFLKFLTLPIALRASRQILEILGLSENQKWVEILGYYDLALGFLFMAALLEMYRIIRIVTHERKGRL